MGRENPREQLIFALDSLVALYFWVNFFVHTIAQGVLLTPDAYLLDFWNIVDFLPSCWTRPACWTGRTTWRRACAYS